MNKINILGTLTKDAELRYIPNGEAVATITIANNKTCKDKGGNLQDIVTYVECVCFGRRAEVANQYFKKGSRILIDGELRLNSWQDKEGKTRQKHYIAINDFFFVDRKKDTQNTSTDANTKQEAKKAKKQEPKIIYENQEEDLPAIDVDDDIPF